MSVLRFALRAVAAAVIAVSISSAANAAIYPPQRQLPAQVVSDFKSSPVSLLQLYPNGGPQMISRVRDLGASDPTTLPGFIALLKEPATTKDQMRAIVAGLAQVARMAAEQDQAFANEIQTAIAGIGNPDVIAAYQAATGDVAIAATGGGGGGTGGPISNPGNTGGSNSGAPTFGALHSTTTVTPSAAGSVNGTSVAQGSVSPR